MRGLLNSFSYGFGSRDGSFRETQIRRGPGRSVFEYRGRLRGRGVAHAEQVVRHRLSAALETGRGPGLFPRAVEGAGAGAGLRAHPYHAQQTPTGGGRRALIRNSSRAFWLHEWGALAFVVAVVIGLIVVPAALLLGSGGSKSASQANLVLFSPQP